MAYKSSNYNLFFRFIEKFGTEGFTGIDPTDPLVIELEDMMEKHNQFFYIGDAIKIQILYVSKRSRQMMGIEPDGLNFYHFYEFCHPEDLKRTSLGRSTLLKLANELYSSGQGHNLMSTNFRILGPEGRYSSILMQMYSFYSSIPYKTVYLLKIHTNIDWYKQSGNFLHYYLGENLSYFRYPDEEMLKIGNVFSAREFEIIRLIEKGLSSEQIAENLFLSPHTVNTHRRNILSKSGHAHISELIYDLNARGIL